MLLNLQFVADWESFGLRKQKDADKNKNKENRLRIHHDYQEYDNVFFTNN